MITGVAIVPSAPILLPENVSRVDIAADLRGDAVAAVRVATAGAAQVVVVAATDRAPRHTKAPLGVRVADCLLGLADVDLPRATLVVPWDEPPPACRVAGERLRAGPGAGATGTPHTALVVVADGSARRGEKAPGHLDERAFAHDDATLAAIAAGDADALMAIDPALAADLLDHGRAPLQVLAGAIEGLGLVSEVLRVEDPFGVRYVVATLRPDNR